MTLFSGKLFWVSALLSLSLASCGSATSTQTAASGEAAPTSAAIASSDSTVADALPLESSDLVPGEPLESLLSCEGEMVIEDAGFGDDRPLEIPSDVVDRLLSERVEGQPDGVWPRLKVGDSAQSSSLTVFELLDDAGNHVGIVEIVAKSGGWDLGGVALCSDAQG